MRILSQDGMIDVPYEQCGFIVFFNELFSGNWDINANIGGNKSYKMAEYSTEEKARKAMEMLREAYCGAVHMKHADYEIEDIDLSQELEKKIREEMMKPHFLDVKINNPVIECKIFQFPADDEVEV